MAPLAALLVYLLAGCWASPAAPDPDPAPAAWLSVAVNPKKMSALVGDRFLSLTMDPVELSTHRRLGPGSVRTLAMARGLAPAYLRLAGPSSDTLRFERGAGASHNGTVTEADVDAVARWSRAAGWHLIVGLNALRRAQGAAAADWDDSDAADLLALADKHGQLLDWQLGYESGALSRAGVSGGQLGEDLGRARELLAAFPRYRDSVLLGPDVPAALAGPRTSRDTRDAVHFLQDEARVAAPAPDAVVWQPWSTARLTEGRDPVNDPDLVREDVNRLLGRAAARRPLWIAESEDAPPRTFGGALQWAARVQAAARVGADVILRRWHSPGDDHQPTPDYWVSLLHKRLCGRAVLDSRLAGNRSAASVTAQCTAAPPAGDDQRGRPGPNPRLLGSFTKLSYERGDVTLFAVNAGPADAGLAVKFSPAAGLHQHLVHEYVLTAPGRDMSSRSTLLNGHVLAIDNGGGLPALTPLVRQSGGGDRETTLVMPPHSMAFFVFPGVHGRACESAPPSTAEAGAGDVLLQLSPTDQGMHVQFDVEGLTQPSKSKTKDKLAATVKSADRHRNVLHETTPRAKRASPAPAPHPPRPGPVSPEDFLGRLAKTHAAHVKQRKHLAGPGAAHAPTTDKEEDEDQFTTIPVAHIWRPDDLEADLQPAAHKPGLRKLPAKPFKLPKRAPLVPSAPRLPKKPAPPRIKPIPRGVAVVSSLVDPQRGVSAEDSAEEEAAEEDHFPTGEVMAELGDSNEEEDSSAGGDEGFDYLSDDENDGEEETDEEGSKKGATTPGYTLDDDKDTEKSQFYFGPGEFMAALKNSAAGPKQAAGRGGEIGELDMSREPVTVPEQSTPPPYEPHLEAFVPVPPPAVTVEQQRLARQRAHQDMESAFYQGTASAARETKNTLPLLPPLAPPPGEQDLNTDLLIELGKRYLREKKMALKRPQPRLDESSCEQGRPSAPSAPSAPGEDEDLPPRQVRTRRQATAVRLALPTGASPRPRPRLRVRPSEDASSRQFPRDVRRELEQRITERRERLDKARESARDQPERALPRPRESDRSDRERAMARTREQLEQQRQQREQTERERLMEAREQLERAREQRDQQARAQQREESLAKAREQLDQQRQQREQQLEQQIRQMREQREQAGRQMRGHERGPLPLPGLRRTERVKRHTASDAASKYMDSFGWSEAQLPHRLQAGAHRVVPAPVHHHHHHNLHHPGLGSTFTSTRYKYGHAPQNVRKNVRHQVVKKTNVVRYVPVDEQPARASAEDHVVARPPSYARLPAATHRRQQVYRPNDNVATMWANSPLSPLRQYGGVQRQSNVQDDADSGSYEQGSPDVPGAALLAVDIDAGDDVPSSPAVETKTVPTEVKTTSIVKTERTYQSPEQDGGYSSESCLDADQEAGSAQFASLEPEAPTYLRAHQHHGHHHHHHRIGDSTPISSYGGVSAEEEGSATDYGAAGREAPKETSFIKEEETSSTEYGWKSAEVQTAADAAEGSEAEEPMPEFPFRTPPGGKGQVVGFTDDDSSPGGWYTFSSEPRRGPSEAPAAELEEYDDRLDPSDSYSTSPARRPDPQAHLEQSGTGRSWSVPLSHIGRKNPSSAGEASYSSGGEEAAGSGQRQHHASSYADSSTGHTAPSQERPAGLAPHDEQQYSAPQPQETAQEPAEPAPYGHNEPTEQAAPAVSYTRDHSSHQPQAPSGQGRSGETLSEYGSHTRDYNAPHPHQKSPVEPEQQASAVQSSYTFSSNGYNAPRPHQPVPAPHEQPAPPVQSSYSSNSNGYNAPTPHQPGPAPHEQPALPIQSSYSVYSNGHNSATRYQQPAPAVQGEQSSAVQSSYTSNSNGYNAPRPHQPVPFSHDQPAPPVQSSYSSYSNGYNSAPAPVEQEQQPTAVQSSYTSNSNGYNAPTPHQPAPAQQEQPTPPVQSSYSNGYYAPGPHQPAPGEHEQQSSAVKSSYTSYSNGYSGVPRPPQTAPAAQEQQSSPVQSSYTSDGYSGGPSPPHQAPVQQEQQSLGIQSSYTSNSNGYDSAPGPRQQSPPDSSSYAAYSNGYSPPSADASAPAVQEERSPAIPPNADSAPQPQTAASAALEQPAFGYEPASSGFAVPKLQAPATLAPPVFEPGQPASSFVTYSNGYSAPRPQAPIPWGGSNSGSALEATLESDATSATRPRAQPQSHRPRRPAQRKQPAQQPLLPPAFAYLSKYFQPVGGAKVDPVGRSPKTADDLWKQPAPAADDLWKQPAPADDLWKEPTPGEDLWKEPTPGEDLWKEPTPGGDLWKQPTQQRPSSALWGKQAPSPAADDADDSLDIWGQPIAKAVRAQAPAPSAQRSQQASLGAPSAEQLLDYNTAILRRNSNAAAPARTAPALMASLAPGGSNAYAVRRPAALRRRRSLHEPAAAPASAAHRSPRGILDVLGGSGKVMTNHLEQDEGHPATATAPRQDAREASGGSGSMVEEVDGPKTIDNVDRLLESLARAYPDRADGKGAVRVLELLPWRLFTRGGGGGGGAAASPI